MAYEISATIKARILKILRATLDYPKTRDWIIRLFLDHIEFREWLFHQIAMHQAREEVEFDPVLFDSLDAIHGFEDCYWLFSSNELNIGLSQLRFDDAAHLYHRLRKRNGPHVVELGRYKGGTTFLLAAAGAKVLSLENDRNLQEWYLPGLARALAHFGLSDRVDARLADAYSYPVEPCSYDLVLVHCSPPTSEHTRSLVERWWPAVVVGGYLVLHATTHLPGELAFIEEMSRAPEVWGAVCETDSPGENVFFQKLEHDKK
jgi:protein-L-isoaspartate O-methyltransferase